MTATVEIVERDRIKRYAGNDNHGKPKQAYLDRLAAMDDVTLFKETKDKIWLAAFAANNPRSDYHWHCDATYDEWVRRNKVDHYDRAHKAVMRAEGHG